MKDFDANLIDSGSDDGDQADPVINVLRLKRQATTTGIGDISKALNNITYSGTGLKAEIVELEENMHYLLSEGKYGYKYIEGTLSSLGYGVSAIREVFKRLTGVSVEEWMDVDAVLNVPGCLPGINHGWGEAKGSQYDYYFIMPYKLGFSIFGQKGDLQRDEVDCTASLEGAREKLGTMVKEIHCWDKPVKLPIKGGNGDKFNRPVDDVKNKEFPKHNFTEPTGEVALTASEDFAKLDDYIYKNIDRIDSGTIDRLVAKARQQKKITKQEESVLRQAYLSIQAEDGEEENEQDISDVGEDGGRDHKKELEKIIDKKEEELVNKPFEEEINEDTPSQYFENNVEEMKHNSVPAEIIDKVFEYVKYKNENLQNFELIVDGFKYTSVQTLEEVKKTIPVDEDTKEAFFDANALVTLLLTILNKSLPSNNNEKKAILIFSIVGGNIITADYVKGQDNKMYGLTEEGCSKMFVNE